MFCFFTGGRVIAHALSRMVGDSATFGDCHYSSGEVAIGVGWFSRELHAKAVVHLNGAPIRSSLLDCFRGKCVWLYRGKFNSASSHWRVDTSSDWRDATRKCRRASHRNISEVDVRTTQNATAAPVVPHRDPSRNVNVIIASALAAVTSSTVRFDPLNFR